MNVDNKLEWLLKKATSGDTAVIHWALVEIRKLPRAADALSRMVIRQPAGRLGQMAASLLSHGDIENSHVYLQAAIAQLKGDKQESILELLRSSERLRAHGKEIIEGRTHHAVAFATGGDCRSALLYHMGDEDAFAIRADGKITRISVDLEATKRITKLFTWPDREPTALWTIRNPELELRMGALNGSWQVPVLPADPMQSAPLIILDPQISRRIGIVARPRLGQLLVVGEDGVSQIQREAPKSISGHALSVKSLAVAASGKLSIYSISKDGAIEWSRPRKVDVSAHGCGVGYFGQVWALAQDGDCTASPYFVATRLTTPPKSDVLLLDDGGQSTLVVEGLEGRVRVFGCSHAESVTICIESDKGLLTWVIRPGERPGPPITLTDEEEFYCGAVVCDAQGSNVVAMRSGDWIPRLLPIPSGP